MATALPAPVVPASPAPDDISLKARIGELDTILKLINDDRARYGVPPLKWDDQLAQHAQEWVDQLAKMGRMEHAPRDGRGVERENLAQGMPWWSTEQLVEEWRGEEKNYVPGTFPNVALDGHWEKVAHWTQDISRLSLEIGCAIAKGSGFLWLDCRFSPGGNKDGEQFGPAVAAARTIAIEPSYVTYDARIEDALSPNLEKAISTGAAGNAAPADVAGAGHERTVQQHWPDFVGNVRIDQAWGSQETMKAIHTINSPPPPVSYNPAPVYIDTNVEPPALPFSDDLLPRTAWTLEPM